MEGLEDDLHRETRRRNTLEMEVMSFKVETRSYADMDFEVMCRHF